MATINAQDLTGDPTGILPGEKRHGSSHIIRWPQPAPVDRRQGRCLTVGAKALPLCAAGELEQNDARRDRIDRYAVRPRFQRQLPRQPDQRVLGRRIGLNARQADAQARARTDSDDPAPPPSSVA